MKVLHVIPSVSERSGGPAQVIGPMCRSLQEQGIEVTIATTDHQVVTSEFARPSVAGKPDKPSTGHLFKGVPTQFFPVQWNDSFKYSRPLAMWLNSNVSSFDLVHIHAVFNHACLAAARACRKQNVPYIIRPLGSLDPRSMVQKSLKKSLFWQLAAKRMLVNAAAVHYTANAEKEAAEKSLSLNHGVVVPLGVDSIADAPLNTGQLFAEFPDLASHPYVLVLSRLHPKKGLDVLLDAFLSVAEDQKFANWRLVLAGEGPADYVGKLRNFAEANRNVDKVIFTGWLEGEKKIAALRGSLLLALPSYQENFGVCIIEALSCGVPVVVSPHVNLATEIQSARAGWIVPVQKLALESALRSALSQPEERQYRGEMGRQFARSFSWPTIAEQLQKLYVTILSDRSPAHNAPVSLAT